MIVETGMLTPEYLTVSDFAERAGVSKQAVYDRIKRDLGQFVCEINGRKMINAAALSCVGKQSIPLEQSVKPLEQTVNQDSSQESSNQSTLLDYLIAENERFRTGIECLHSKIADKDALIADKVEQAQSIAKQALDADLEQNRTPWQRLIERLRRK